MKISRLNALLSPTDHTVSMFIRLNAQPILIAKNRITFTRMKRKHSKPRVQQRETNRLYICNNQYTPTPM